MKKLTEGKPIKVILIFMLPLLVGQIFQLLYNLVDTRIVGQILGEDALAAVASTTSLSDLLITLIYGLTNGFAIITASFFGAKDEKNLKKSIAGTFTLGVAISVILSVFCLIFIDPLLRLIKVDEKLYTDAKSYILIILAGLIVTALYNICACTLRSIGDSVTPLIFLIISALLNIMLDYSFIKFLHLGVAGAALATVISQIVSVILCFIYISRKYRDLIPCVDDFRFDRLIITKQLMAGTSMGFMNSFVSIGTVCLQTQINTFGPEIIVSHAASRKMFSLISMPFFVLATTLASFSAQNMGAGKYERIKEGLRDTIALCGIWTVICIIIARFFTDEIIYQIVGMNNEMVLATSSRYMQFHSYFFLVLAVVCVFRNAMQGFGDSITPIVSSFLELFVKVLVSFLLVPHIGYDGVILCEPVAWCIMVIPLVINMLRSPVFDKRAIF